MVNQVAIRTIKSAQTFHNVGLGVNAKAGMPQNRAGYDLRMFLLLPPAICILGSISHAHLLGFSSSRDGSRDGAPFIFNTYSDSREYLQHLLVCHWATPIWCIKKKKILSGYKTKVAKLSQAIE